MVVPVSAMVVAVVVAVEAAPPVSVRVVPVSARVVAVVVAVEATLDSTARQGTHDASC